MLDYGEFVPEALVTSTDASLAKMGAKMDLVPEDETLDFSGEEGCVELVVAGTHAHLETFSYLLVLYRVLGVSSKVYYMKPQLYRGHLAFLFRKHTPWRHKFSTGLQRLLEAGLVYKWHDEIMDSFSSGEGEVGAAVCLSCLSLALLSCLYVLIIASKPNICFWSGGYFTKCRS